MDIRVVYIDKLGLEEGGSTLFHLIPTFGRKEAREEGGIGSSGLLGFSGFRSFH